MRSAVSLRSHVRDGFFLIPVFASNGPLGIDVVVFLRQSPGIFFGCNAGSATSENRSGVFCCLVDLEGFDRWCVGAYGARSSPSPWLIRVELDEPPSIPFLVGNFLVRQRESESFRGALCFSFVDVMVAVLHPRIARQAFHPPPGPSCTRLSLLDSFLPYTTYPVPLSFRPGF